MVINEPLRRIPWPVIDPNDPEALVTREWLVTNGLGGYASGTVSGIMTRRYHGLLIAALPAPMGRVVMLSHLQAGLRFQDGQLVLLDLEGLSASASNHQGAELVEFRLE